MNAIRVISAVLALSSVFAVGCSSDDSSTGGNGNGNGGSSSSSSSSNCTKTSKCINGACTCTSGPNDGKSCCKPENDSSCSESSSCDVFCKYCE